MVDESRELVRVAVELAHLRDDMRVLQRTLETMRNERERLFVTRREMRAVQWLVGLAVTGSATSAALWVPRILGY